MNDGESPPGAPRWHTREDSGLRLDGELRWWHDGGLLDHPKIVEAFNRGLEPTDDGKFILRFGPDWCFVQVEEAAYSVLAIDAGADRIGLRLSNRTAQPLEPSTLRIGHDGVLRCRVMNGRAIARFTRDAQFELGGLCEDDGGTPMLPLGGRRWPIREE